MTTPLPEGFRIILDADVRTLGDRLWWGGSPSRLLRFTEAGYGAWQELRAGAVLTPAMGRLARQLTDAGLAHPRPPRRAAPADITVVIPVRDRPEMLGRCLDALGDRYPVVVVDDCSADASAVARVAARPGVTLLRHEINQGPAVARNTALHRVRTDLVAFLDSDCVPGPEWLERLAEHFADPMVGAVAPRVTALHPDERCALDRGVRAARVLPNARVSFVPAAALLVRRGALYDISTPDGVFDPDLRYGEDVDLVWRLHAADWRVRYDPSVRVAHEEPMGSRRLLARRFRYGGSAAPLASRHPTALSPLIVYGWSAATVLALLHGRPVAALALFGGCLAGTGSTLRRAGVPTGHALRLTAGDVFRTWTGIARYSTQFTLPLLLIAVPARGRRALFWWSMGALLLGRIAGEPTAGNPLRTTPAVLADDLAYGLGVVAGCVREKTTIPLRPTVIHRWRRTEQRTVPRSSR
ncbi:mycofactocin biosynthesis glycosyltransferase MftF [Nocardia jejuensis]|uniref:mycofactocin biosynthesis glycosyltransferase MftF n=1 Tax=Nocardia jejuensis TaxID=328049 RepID=UPI00083338DC|nr:mycofactocin biosynthesis glycosyltransferase MftF [Nocardia jejuensis]